jgi:hypothetical protein
MTTRTAVLGLAAVLMIVGALGNACVLVPDLHGDLIEIGVRPTVLGATVHALYFSALAMFGFAVLVSVAAFDSARGLTPARVPLAIAGIIYAVTGAMLFGRSRSPHHFAVVLMGVLLLIAVAIPTHRST